MKFRILFFVLFFLGASGIAQQNPVSLTTTIAPSEGTLEDQFQLSIKVQGARLTSPLIGGSDAWEIVTGGTSTEMRRINDSLQVSTTYTFSLYPKREGSLQTPPLRVVVNGTAYDAPRKTVLIKKQNSEISAGDAKKDVLVTQSLSKKTVFKGEQVTLTIQALTQVDLSEPNLTENPIDGVWSERFGEEENFRKNLYGVSFYVSQFRRALFPLREGILTIPSTELRARIPDENADDFLGGPSIINRFFGPQSFKQIRRSSEPIAFEVMRLPPAPSQAQLWGMISPLVGETHLDLRSDTSGVRVGETKAFTLEVTSIGNLNLLKNAPLWDGKGYKVYSESPTLKNTVDGNYLVYKKRFNLSVVPSEPGVITLPPLELTYFDPTTKTYQIARTATVSFEATGKALSNQHAAVASLSPIIDATSGATPHPVLRYEEPTTIERMFHSVSITVLLWIITALSCLVALRYWYRRNKQSATVFEPIASDDPEKLLHDFFQRKYGISTKTKSDLLVAITSSSLPSDTKLLFMESISSRACSNEFKDALRGS